MDIDLEPLRSALAAEGIDGYLIDADGSDSDQRYVSDFTAPDPYQTLITTAPTGQSSGSADSSESAGSSRSDEIGGRRGVHLLVSGLEYGRARADATVDSIARRADFDYRDRVAEYGPQEGTVRTIAAFLESHGVVSVAVPPSFPTGTADGLREQGISVTVESERIVETEIRARKSEWEIEQIQSTQRANERAMAVAEELIATAEVEDDVLVHDGDPLTSERVTTGIEIELLRNGCALDETIVACSADGADPHDRGSGPLEADELIVIDIFPRDKETGYFGDMTRTFLRGVPSEEQRRRYDVTQRAYEAALEAVEAGVTGAEIHDVACDVIEDAGYKTLRSDPTTETGYIHNTGHGVGLDIHEQPTVSPSGGELEPGHVVSIEPGIYDPAVGGVRIEDLVVVTEDGHRNFNEYGVHLEPKA